MTAIDTLLKALPWPGGHRVHIKLDVARDAFRLSCMCGEFECYFDSETAGLCGGDFTWRVLGLVGRHLKEPWKIQTAAELYRSAWRTAHQQVPK